MSSAAEVDAAARYRRLAARFTELIEAVPAERWDAASPCEGWTAADVVAHVVSTQLDLLGRQPFAPTTPVELADPAAAWPQVRDLVQAALDDPERATHAYDGYFGPTTFAATVDGFYCPDLVIHAWDVATAAGLAELRAIEPQEMTAIQAGLSSVGDTLRQPGLFGPALEVAPDASEQTRFLAFTGRAG